MQAQNEPYNPPFITTTLGRRSSPHDILVGTYYSDGRHDYTTQEMFHASVIVEVSGDTFRILKNRWGLAPDNPLPIMYLASFLHDSWVYLRAHLARARDSYAE